MFKLYLKEPMEEQSLRWGGREWIFRVLHHYKGFTQLVLLPISSMLSYLTSTPVLAGVHTGGGRPGISPPKAIPPPPPPPPPKNLHNQIQQ